MNLSRLCHRALMGALVLGAFASCSKDGGSVLGPGPGPPPPPGDAAGYFVNASIGHDDSAGTKAAPFKSIRKAIQAASLAGVDVFVAQGSYAGSGPLELARNVSVFGGYEGATWQRDPGRYVSEIVGTANYPTVKCSYADSLTLDGFTIRNPNQTTPGVSSICIQVDGVSVGIVISNNSLFAGKGADGTNGTTADTPSGAGNGRDGEAPGLCQNLGGAGGTSLAGWPGGAGGNGGAYDGYPGSNASGSDATFGGGGAGGTLASPEGKPGKGGRDGQNGSHGQVGDSVGTFAGTGYNPSNGTGGTPGAVGRGGGGGGGAFGNGISCGAGGGGGGGGGRGGDQGMGAGGGAGSFGIYISGSSTVEIINNKIVTAGGGRGGAAGQGSAGRYGLGGNGGQLILFASGGHGGTGGAGGDGGWGGAGGGGPSIGILEVQFATTSRAGNSVTLGAAGEGGTTEAAGEPNAPRGIVRDYAKFN